MYRKIVNYLRGEVEVRCCSAAPERVLNLCSVHDIPFWDVVWEDAAHIRFRTTTHGRRELQQVMETAAVEVEEASPRRILQNVSTSSGSAPPCPPSSAGRTMVVISPPQRGVMVMRRSVRLASAMALSPLMV